METTTIDMRPKPFEPPFKYEQLDLLAKNRLKLWQKRGRVLGDGSIHVWNEYGMERVKDSEEMNPHTVSSIGISKNLADALRQAKDFADYHERHADEHGGLNVEDCHEWGNAKEYNGGDISPRSLLYGIRLSFNDGSVLFFKIESKHIEEI